MMLCLSFFRMVRKFLATATNAARTTNLPCSYFNLLLAAVIALLCGCTKHTDESDTHVSLAREDSGFVIVIAVDLSGSFADRMTRDGKGYEFTMRVVDKYFRNSVGTNNRIIIAQLSATDRALLWDGTPMQLRQSLPNAAEFHDYLLRKSHPAGSRINDGVSDAIDYILTDPNFAKTRAALFVLSDFDDNAPNPKESERRLVQALNAFGRKNGVVGFYFVDQFHVPMWRQHLQQSGIKNWVCESEIVAYPALPSFE